MHALVRLLVRLPSAEDLCPPRHPLRRHRRTARLRARRRRRLRRLAAAHAAAQAAQPPRRRGARRRTSSRSRRARRGGCARRSNSSTRRRRCPTARTPSSVSSASARARSRPSARQRRRCRQRRPRPVPLPRTMRDIEPAVRARREAVRQPPLAPLLSSSPPPSGTSSARAGGGAALAGGGADGGAHVWRRGRADDDGLGWRAMAARRARRYEPTRRCSSNLDGCPRRRGAAARCWRSSRPRSPAATLRRHAAGGDARLESRWPSCCTEQPSSAPLALIDRPAVLATALEAAAAWRLPEPRDPPGVRRGTHPSTEDDAQLPPRHPRDARKHAGIAALAAAVAPTRRPSSSRCVADALRALLKSRCGRRRRRRLRDALGREALEAASSRRITSNARLSSSAPPPSWPSRAPFPAAVFDLQLLCRAAARSRREAYGRNALCPVSERSLAIRLSQIPHTPLLLARSGVHRSPHTWRPLAIPTSPLPDSPSPRACAAPRPRRRRHTRGERTPSPLRSRADGGAHLGRERRRPASVVRCGGALSANGFFFRRRRRAAVHHVGAQRLQLGLLLRRLQVGRRLREPRRLRRSLRACAARAARFAARASLPCWNPLISVSGFVDFAGTNAVFARTRAGLATNARFRCSSSFCWRRFSSWGRSGSGGGARPASARLHRQDGGWVSVGVMGGAARLLAP